MRLPFPSSPPNDAEYIGPYFGAGAQIVPELKHGAVELGFF